MFPSDIKDWKKLESNIKKLESITLKALFIENNREKKIRVYFKAYIQPWKQSSLGFKKNYFKASLRLVLY